MPPENARRAGESEPPLRPGSLGERSGLARSSSSASCSRPRRRLAGSGVALLRLRAARSRPKRAEGLCRRLQAVIKGATSKISEPAAADHAPEERAAAAQRSAAAGLVRIRSVTSGSFRRVVQAKHDVLFWHKLCTPIAERVIRKENAGKTAGTCHLAAF